MTKLDNPTLVRQIQKQIYTTAGPEPKVLVGCVHPTEVNAFFMTSLIAMRETRPQGSTPFVGVYSGPKIDEARNHLFRIWLDETDAEYFLMVDTDMVLPRDTIQRLLRADKDIVGGLCFAGGTSGSIKPTLHTITESEEGTPEISILWDYPLDSLVQVAGTGAACMLIKRKVAEKVREARGPDHPMPWFAHGMHNGVKIGEDIAFCLTAGKCGFEVWVDTGLEIGHVKPHIVEQRDYVVSLSREDHPYYNNRQTVPIYQEMVNGNSSQPSNRQGSEEVPATGHS